MRSSASSWLAALVAVVLALPLFGRSESYENVDFGFKLRAPRGWTQVPNKTEEQWQVVKFLSDKSNFWTGKDGGWTWEHRPELSVIAFVTEVTRKRAEVEKKKDGDKDSITIVLRNPYRDYLDYFKRGYRDGGFYVSDEKDVEIGGVPVHVYEIKIEKLATTGPKRVITWVFKQPEVEFAVEFVVLEDAYSKWKNVIDDTMRSFKLIPRTGAGLPTGDSGGVIVIEDDGKLTPKQRKEKRVELEKRAHERARKSTPDDWSAFKTKRFLVLSHTDDKYAKRVAEHGEALFAWLEATFPYVGPEEYVRQPVLRICKDDEEYRAFRTGGDWFSFGMNPAEVVTYNDKAGFATGWAIEWLNYSLLSLWFQERDRELWWAMPSWLGTGLRITIQTARADRAGKVEFKVDGWDRDEVRDQIREGGAIEPKTMLRMRYEELQSGADQSYWGNTRQAGFFVRYLLIGPGAKNSKTKDLLRDYVKNLKQVVVEAKAEHEQKGDSPAKPTSEEEEDAYYKRQQEQWRKNEQKTLDSVFERTFRGWSDKQWEGIASDYLQAIGIK